MFSWVKNSKETLRNVKNSLFARLLITFLVTSLIIFILVGVFFRHVIHQKGRDIEKTILHYIEYMQNDIGEEPKIYKLKEIAYKASIDILIKGEKLNWSSSDKFPRIKDLTFRSINNDVMTARLRHQHFFLIIKGNHKIVLTTPKLDSKPYGYYLGFLLILIIMLILLACYKYVQNLFKPISHISDGVKLFSKGALDYRIPIIKKDELAKLTMQINDMATEINQMLISKKNLLLAISHELRTPITRMKVAIEFIKDKKVKTSLDEDIIEVEDLINDLLEIERINTKQKILDKTKININGFIKTIVEKDFSNQEPGVEVTCSNVDDTFDVDMNMFKLLMKNLLENALRYSVDKTKPVQVNIKSENNNLDIIVKDYGEGIGTEHLPYLLEPFYRVDPSRQRKTGGYGLGLYLCKLIVEAHDGKIELDSVKGIGTSVIISFLK